jgi:glucose-6-phosphate isomerase
VLKIPAQLGGRFSVLSAVGLFPLCMIDIDIDQLLAGARYMRDICLSNEDNYAVQTAAWQYALLQQGYDISNLFLFSNELQSCGKWWRQLMGESLGKAQSIDGQKNEQTFVPTVSVGSTDLHSVGQLYLANVAKIITQFVVVEQNHFELMLPDYAKFFSPLVKDIQNKSLADIMRAIFSGVQKAYIKKDLPFCTVTFPEKNAYYIGQFLQYKMFEICYIAKLLNIDPFDQPEVETYKIETREILSRE